MEEDSETGSPASAGQASSGPRKRQRRRAITDVQRKDLRVHKKILVQKTGTWSLNQMIDFFNKKYDRVLTKSTISESLSNTFGYLDDEDHPLHPDSKRRRESKWPDLEAALFDWQQQTLKKNGAITNDVLKAMAKDFHHRLPQYHDVDAPVFSTAWLEAYKARYQVQKSLRGDGKSDAADRVLVETGLDDLRENLKAFDCEDIYNMDEVALFWKMSPDATLARECKAKGKLVKARVTVNLACNVTGSRKLRPWFIGRARTPRCFHRSGVHVTNLPVVWRYNKKAWMTGVLFEEYLRWFDKQMAGRKVCLLIDELSAHQSGVCLLYSRFPEGLANTTVRFLPTTTASVRHPLDQGVIRSWKAHYRRRWLAHMCAECDAHSDPMKSVNVLQAIRWGVSAWEDDVSRVTIRDSWIKSRVLGLRHGLETEGWKNFVYEDEQMMNDTLTQMGQWIKSLVHRGHIKSGMDVADFVSPDDEIVIDDDEDVFGSLVDLYGTGGAERDHETDEEDVAVAPVEASEALELVARLRLYEEQQRDGDETVILGLNKYERDIRARMTG